MFRKTAFCLTALFCCTVLMSLRVSAQTTDPSAPFMPNPFLRPPISPEVIEHQRLFDEKVRPLWQVAHHNYWQGKLAEAEKACQQIIVLDEDYYGDKDKVGIDFLGEIYLREGQNEKARDCFQQAFPLGNDAPLFLNLALVDCRLGYFEEARRLYFSPVVQQHIISGSLIYSKATVESLPDLEYEQGLYASVAWACGMDRSSTSQAAEAIEHFQVADKLWPKNPLVHYQWARSLAELGRAREALPHYQLAIARGSGTMLKMAKEGAVRAQGYVETQARLKAQQAEQKTQAQGKTAP